MLATFRMRRAGENDLAEVMEILEARREWLRDVKHSDQWSNVAEWRTLLRHLIRHGNVWVLVVDDENEEIVGTVTLDRDPDFDFWSPQQRQESALYLSKLATSPRYCGRALGELILDWALDRAARERCTLVRLDTWKTSARLQEYYTKHGWRNVGVVDIGHRQSGALFERDARYLPMSLVVDERRGNRRDRASVADATCVA